MKVEYLTLHHHGGEMALWREAGTKHLVVNMRPKKASVENEVDEVAKKFEILFKQKEKELGTFSLEDALQIIGIAGFQLAANLPEDNLLIFMRVSRDLQTPA